MTSHRVTLVLLAAVAVLAVVGLSLVLGHQVPESPTSGPGLNQRACAAGPQTCGFPDASSTGVPARMTLKSVPAQVSSGPGWSYDRAAHLVDVTRDGAVLADLSIPCDLNITASDVTIKDDRVVTGGAFAISLRDTAGVTIEDDTISGRNTGGGRVDAAIADVYGNSTGIVIQDNNISAFRNAIQVSSGLISGNYIHNPGYIPGDHTNGIIANGGTKPLIIYHNTILNSLSQTDAITIDTEQGRGPVANKTIEDNLLAGGSYPIYGGTAFGHATSRIVIENNRFSQGFYRTSGHFGPVAYFNPAGPGNVWSGNIWNRTGTTIPAPKDSAGSQPSAATVRRYSGEAPAGSERSGRLPRVSR
jgi:phage baseplate assembly protein gpV